MKFRADYFFVRSLPLGLLLTLAACGGEGAPQAAVPPPSNGPAADFPVVIGEPFTIDGVTYTPIDKLNYDEVGYATRDADAATGVSAAHRTLPLPSYVEVTSLETGKTILVRVERRGPMTGSYLIALSPDAEKQLGSGDNTAVRVRRVNPPEQERALLRQKESAPMRMDTPKSLVDVLRRKLPDGAASSVKVEPEKAVAPASVPSVVELPPSAAAPSTPGKAGSRHVQPHSGQEIAPKPEPVHSPDPVPNPVPTATPVPATPAAKAKKPAPPAAKAPPPAKAPVTKGFMVQVGTFSAQERAQKVANALTGRVKKSGTYWLALTGPFASKKEAEASLAKAAAKGYSGGRIYRTD